MSKIDCEEIKSKFILGFYIKDSDDFEDFCYRLKIEENYNKDWFIQVKVKSDEVKEI